MNTKVDAYFNQLTQWQNELNHLREIILDCGLQETYKWRTPVYTYQDKNIVLIGGFKHYCVLSFFKGVLLSDEANILIKGGEESRIGRIIRFTDLQNILSLENHLKAYIFEAIEVEKAGIKLPSFSADLVYCNELKETLESQPKLNKAFEALTPGRKRAYNMHFSSAKQPNTRYRRIEKYIPRILDGFGINDCICGRSKRMPTCDGSHKKINQH